jgi:hypothetical protein
VSRRKRYTRNLGRERPATVPRQGTGSRYVRFVHEHEPYGVFSHFDVARVRLGEPERTELDELLGWFRAHLDLPTSLVPVHEPTAEGGEGPRAVCWFRASASEHILRARRVAILLREARIPIIERWSDELPGRICSADEAQLAISPFWP